jgi:hypothetical protein
LSLNSTKKQALAVNMGEERAYELVWVPAALLLLREWQNVNQQRGQK